MAQKQERNEEASANERMAAQIDELARLVADSQNLIKPVMKLRRPGVLGSLAAIIGALVGAAGQYNFTHHNLRRAELEVSQNQAKHAAAMAELTVGTMKLEMDNERLGRTNAKIGQERQQLEQQQEKLQGESAQLRKEATALNEEKTRLAQERASLQRYIANIPSELRESLERLLSQCQMECATLYPNLGDKFDGCFDTCMRRNNE